MWWLILVIVVIAGLAMMLAERRHRPADVRVLVTDDGLELDDRTVPWAAIHQVAIVTARDLWRPWHGFEVRTEESAPLLIDGSSELGRRFLAESYRLPGFDHAILEQALQERRGRHVCFDR